MLALPDNIVGETRARIVEEAKTWLGTPFHHRAFVKGAGTDCQGFIYSSYRVLGLIPELEMPEYSPQWWAHRERELYIESLIELGLHEITGPPSPGDIVLAKWGRCFSHSGIVIDWPMVIHTSPMHKKVQIDDAKLHLLFGAHELKFFSIF
jgi:cell wall-associated NlpC family hydrolase